MRLWGSYTPPMRVLMVPHSPTGISHNLQLACTQDPCNAQYVLVAVIAATHCLLAWVMIIMLWSSVWNPTTVPQVLPQAVCKAHCAETALQIAAWLITQPQAFNSLRLLIFSVISAATWKHTRFSWCAQDSCRAEFEGLPPGAKDQPWIDWNRVAMLHANREAASILCSMLPHLSSANHLASYPFALVRKGGTYEGLSWMKSQNLELQTINKLY